MLDRDLFVSHGTRDGKDVAEDVVADLESRWLVCWIAPRDMPAGSRSWASEIVKGIRSSRNFLLVLSTAANRSEEIEKEVDEAARQRKPLFVIRVEDVEPNEGLADPARAGKDGPCLLYAVDNQVVLTKRSAAAQTPTP